MEFISLHLLPASSWEGTVTGVKLYCSAYFTIVHTIYLTCESCYCSHSILMLQLSDAKRRYRAKKISGSHP
jgi:hypothetical protein